MKFEVTPAGKKELSGPETWAKNPNTVKLVTRLLKGGVDTDSISDKERGRLNRWVNLGYLKRSGVEKTTGTKHTKTLAKAA